MMKQGPVMTAGKTGRLTGHRPDVGWTLPSPRQSAHAAKDISGA